MADLGEALRTAQQKQVGIRISDLAVRSLYIVRQVSFGNPNIVSCVSWTVNNTPFGAGNSDMRQPCAAGAPVDGLVDCWFQVGNTPVEGKQPHVHAVVAYPYVPVRVSCVGDQIEGDREGRKRDLAEVVHNTEVDPGGCVGEKTAFAGLNDV